MFTLASLVEDHGDVVSACCSTYGNVAGAHFDEKLARRDLENYRKKGPGPTARLLRDMLGNAGSTQQARSVNRDEVLLLQLNSDYGVNFMFCDVGEVEFWIDKRDLASRRFDRVSASTCGG